MKQRMKTIIIFAFFALAIFIWQKVYKRNNAIKECENMAETICLEYGIDNVGVDTICSGRYDGYTLYQLNVNGNFDDVSMDDVYQMVKSIDKIMMKCDDVLLLKRITLNNDEYELDVLNEKELTCNGETVYVYVSDDDKIMMDDLKNKLPYIGMREEFLEYTLLGKADSVEKCRDFYSLQPRARYKTYEWEATNSHGWYKITVRYRMHRSQQFDDYIDLPIDNGYVSSITWTAENGIVQNKNDTDIY